MNDTEAAHGGDGTAYDVCVIGLGPTGLVMAHLLALRGVRVLVLEREPDYYGMARAVYTDDECLRILQAAGLADEVHADMVVGLPVQWVRADGRVLAQFHDPSRRNGWPTSNFLYQPDFEATLERRLRERPGVTVRRGRAVLDVGQDGDGAWIRHQQCTGAAYGRREAELVADTMETTRAVYVIAADGGRSTVRTQLGIPMSGKSFPQRWLVIDLHARDGADAFGHLPYFDFVCDPALPTVSCPQPNGRHRFEFMLHDDDDPAQFEAADHVRSLLARHVDPDAVIVDRQLVYTFNALVADRWRAGRIFLAGDAAHMTPQFIGQGMNSGIRDADNLSWKIADVLLRQADPALLETYESERRPHAESMIGVSVLNKDIVSTSRPTAIRARDWGIGATMKVPGLRRVLTEAKIKPRPRFRRDTYFGMPRGPLGAAGTLAPQPAVRGPGGRATRLDDAIGPGWAIVGIGVDPRAVVDAGDWTPVRPRWVSLFPAGSRSRGLPAHGASSGEVIDLEAGDAVLGRWLRRTGIRAGDVVILRPDNYVFGVVRATARRTARLRVGVDVPAAAVAAMREVYPGHQEVPA
ncbi:MAG: bifunctional 3-(3-hydroxy-phenyl)propionate/3-hydroxycinnamic acid hydroxylase [Dermatophilaceae bacterium]